MSLPGLILETATLEDLRCKSCHNYLSVPPIKIALEGYHCGRCDIEGFRASAYEAVAKSARFPCKNDWLGCIILLSFEEVLAHESSCVYNPMDCPLCDQNTPRKGIKQHLRTHHADLVVTGGIPLPRDSIDCKRLVILRQEIFILCIHKPENDKFFIVLTSIDPKAIEYSLVVKSKSNKLVLGGQEVIPHNSLQDYISNEKNMQSDKKIKSFLRSENYTFDFEVAGKETEFQFVEELECTICHEYMKPPVFNCSRGHTLCGACRGKVTDCPMCKSRFEGARNFVLERLLERVGYPCQKHPGCTFSGSLEALKAHEGGCTKRFPCPFKSSSGCNYSGTSSDTFQHLTELHSLASLALCQDMRFKTQLSFSMFVMRFDNKNFVLKVTLGDSECTFLLKDVEKDRGAKSRYKFVVELIEQGGQGRKHIMHNPCNSTLHLHKRSLAPFIGSSAKPDKPLCFKVNVESA